MRVWRSRGKKEPPRGGRGGSEAAVRPAGAGGGGEEQTGGRSLGVERAGVMGSPYEVGSYSRSAGVRYRRATPSIGVRFSAPPSVVRQRQARHLGAWRGARSVLKFRPV